jgi:hypothetical protein
VKKYILARFIEKLASSARTMKHLHVQPSSADAYSKHVLMNEFVCVVCLPTSL